MAITIENNLYPPIFESSYAPAFLYNDKCKVYFSLSEFNSINNLHRTYPLQIVVQKQNTNQTALNINRYPNGIKLSNIQVDTNGKYYFQITNEDIQGGFNLNEYYKVQVRLTGSNAETPNPASGLNTWINNNLSYFSEWSTVLLIYGISEPVIQIKNFSTSSINTFDNINVPIVGTVSFNNSRDKEKLKGYQICIYDSNNNLLEDSGIKYTNNYQNSNEINYHLSYNYNKNVNYTLKIYIVTKNLYTSTVQYTFKIIDSSSDDFHATVTTQPIEESGCIKIRIVSSQIVSEVNYVYTNTNDLLTGKSLVLTLTDPNIGKFKSAMLLQSSSGLLLYNNSLPSQDLSQGTKIILRRSSSKTYFKEWEEIGQTIIQHPLVAELICFDYTVEPGVWYKYEIVRYKNIDQNILISSILTTPVMVYTDDLFLSANNQQLRVRFNPQITNFSVKVSESSIETIGSQYPYIRRNGNTYYRTFGISGTITHFMNTNDNVFNASKKDLYKQDDILQLYKNFNEENNITLYKDFIYERDFRDKVIEFLYADNVKLFRSLTQGNIFVKLMNISLTPNRNLGRMIYDFSCTAYEVDANAYQNYAKYNVAIDKSKEIL